MAMANGAGWGKSNVAINVTPLIDVLLVLLIIFMVISPIPTKGLDARIPEPSAGLNHRAETAVVVEVLKTRSGAIDYKLNREELSLADLPQRLQAIFSIRESKVMFLRGDANLDFSTIAQVLDVAKRSGAENIGLITPKNVL